MRRWPPRVIALVALVVGALAASADEPRRVVMMSPPPGLDTAVESALAGWPIAVTTAQGDPGATMPAAGEKARAIGAAEGAGAVVWIASDGTGHAVWVYDVPSGRVTARRLAHPPPFDEPTAAAVALTIKTLLRHSAVVPVLERYGVEEARAQLRAEVAAGGARSLAREPPIRLETVAGARIRPTEASDLELRLGAGLRYTPGWLGGRGSALARIRTGSGVAVTEPDFVGRYSDLTASLGAAARFLAGSRVALVPSAGASLHFTSIDGAVRSQAARGHASRINPSLDGAIAIELQVGQLVRLSVSGEMSYALRRQVYLVGGDPVLTLPRLEAEIGVAVSVPLE